MRFKSATATERWVVIDTTVSISFYLLVMWFHSIPPCCFPHSLLFCYPEFQQDCGQTPSFLSLGLKLCQSLLRLRGEH